MLPLTPAMPYTRSKAFVNEEWNVYFSNGRAENADGGWKSILIGNYAIINPQGAWNWFSVPRGAADIDGGLSQTWGLAFAGSMLLASFFIFNG